MKHRIVSASEKRRQHILPFLTFPLTKSCNLRCRYCGDGGEMSASAVDQWRGVEAIGHVASEAGRQGIQKFRLTGGEPLVHPDFATICRRLEGIVPYVHVNTNGTLLKRHARDLAGLSRDVFHFAVSLDTLHEGTFDALTHTKGQLGQVVEGTRLLAELGLLLRVNMVVTQANIDHVPMIIAFCSEVGCHLKLLDVVSVPLPFDSRPSLHVSLNPVEEWLSASADGVEDHAYAASFGTPCTIYRVGDVRVTVKSTWNGSRYDRAGICRGCEYYPCHEGLYDIFALPDGRIVGCRWNESSVAKQASQARDASSTEGTRADLEWLCRVFQRAEHVPRTANPPMAPYPEFVTRRLAAPLRRAPLQPSSVAGPA